MKKLIHNLRQKPDHKKRTIAFGVSGAITTAIFVVWASVHMYGSDSQQVLAEKNTDIMSPLETVRLNMASAFSGIQASFGGLQKQIKDLGSTIDEEYKSKVSNTYTEGSL